jgi:hypothetical protein
MLKEIEVLDWCSITIKLALDEVSRDGQKLEEKVTELENTLAMERYMFWECSFFDFVFFGYLLLDLVLSFLSSGKLV